VQTKVVKRMESFRVRNSKTDEQRKLLLPISFGVSSVILLHILDQHLDIQLSRTGRAGFSLCVVFIDSAVESTNNTTSFNKLHKLQSRYPRHSYNIWNINETLEQKSLPLNAWSTGSVPHQDGSHTGLRPESYLSELLYSLPSAISRTDMLGILRTRAIVKIAENLGCEGILWGDTTTRLAEKILAETAKGRGFSLPWLVKDGDSCYGINFTYPMKDLLRKEVLSYAEIVFPPMHELFDHDENKHVSVSAKNTTIDELMKDYFGSVEDNYPSIVANVVRTTGKLKALNAIDSDRACTMCSMPVPEGSFGLADWGGDQESSALPESAFTNNKKPDDCCYGCARSTRGTTAVQSLSKD